MARLSSHEWLVTYRDKCSAPEIEPGYGHPPQYYPGPTLINFIDRSQRANHYARPPPRSPRPTSSALPTVYEMFCPRPNIVKLTQTFRQTVFCEYMLEQGNAEFDTVAWNLVRAVSGRHATEQHWSSAAKLKCVWTIMWQKVGFLCCLEYCSR